MEFDGSMTPPLTDDEDFDDRTLSPQHSPILSKKMKVERKRSTKACTKACTQADRICADNKGAELFYVGSAENNAFVTVSQPCEKLFVDEARATSGFYKCIMHIRNVHQCAIQEMQDNCSVDASAMILSFLQSASRAVKQLLADGIEDKIFTVTELLSMLCTEISLVSSDGQKHIHKYLSSRYRFSDTKTYLHHCGNKELINWFHLYPIIHLQTLDIFQDTCQKLSSANKLEVVHSNGQSVVETEGLLAQFLCRIIYDMFAMSSALYKQLVITENRGGSFWNMLALKSSFPCECFKEFLEKCFVRLGDNLDVWSIVGSIINNVLQSVKSSTSDEKSSPFHRDYVFQCEKDALTFAWWWIKNMPFSTRVSHSASLVTRLIRLSLTKCEMDDLHLSYHLHCYCEIIKILRTSASDAVWNSSVLGSFHLLWRNYSQKLNATMQTQGNKLCDIKNHFAKEISVRDWIDECKLLDENLLESLEKKSFNSFVVFAAVLQTLLKESKGKVWQQIKDRFFSRIQISTLKELNEFGIYRFFSITLLLLLYCSPTDGEHALSLSFSLLEHRSIVRAEFQKQKLLITGYFSMMHVCMEKKISFEAVATRVANFFMHLCRVLAGTATVDYQSNIWKIFSFYLWRTSDLVQASQDFFYGQTALIPSRSLNCVLEKCPTVMANSILSALQEVFSSLRLQCEPNGICDKGCIALSNQLLNEFLPWLKRRGLSSDFQEPEIPLEFAQDVTWLSLHFSDSLSTFSILWKLFAAQGKFDGVWRCGFLSKCLKCRDVLSTLNVDYVVANSSVRKNISASELCDAAVQGWIKSSFVIDEKDHGILTELNCAMLELQAIKEVHEADCLTFSSLIGNLSKRYKQAKDFLTRVKWTDVANRWLAPTVDTALRVVKSPHSTSGTVSCLYCAVGTVIESCSDMLYTNNKPSFVSRVFDHLIFLRDKSAIGQNRLREIQNALLLSLHKYIIGLLQPRVNSMYAQKVLKQIVKTHLSSWSCVNKTNGVERLHPFLQVLKLCSTEAKNTFLNSILAHVSTVTLPEDSTLLIVEILYSWFKVEWELDPENKNMNSLSKFVPFLQQARVQLRPMRGFEEKTNALLQAFRS